MYLHFTKLEALERLLGEIAPVAKFLGKVVVSLGEGFKETFHYIRHPYEVLCKEHHDLFFCEHPVPLFVSVATVVGAIALAVHHFRESKEDR